MAANEEGKSALWRSPLSTPIRRNENSSQDIFQHLEKLIASTVSICRLKGSLECQTGGLITVAEELQRLVRFAISEISRVECDMKRYKANYEDEIGCLKHQVKSLEEEKDSIRRQLQELIKANQDGAERGGHTDIEEKRLHLEGCFDGFHSVAEQEDSEANLSNHVSCDDAEDLEPLLTIKSTPQRKEHTDPLKTTLRNARIGKSKTLEVAYDEECKSNGTRKSSKPRSRGGKNPRQKKDTLDIKESISHVASVRHVTGNLLESKKDEEQEEQMTEFVTKRKRSLSSRPRGKEERKEKYSTIKPEDRVDKGKVSEQIIGHDDKALDEVCQENPVSVASVDTTPRSNKKRKLLISSEAKRKSRVDDPLLVNLSFLIDINTRMSDFVNADVKELELPPMTSRQRSDVHKLTKLYNVRGRFGNKSDNGTTMILVKNADSQQPRAGQADALLSELSIAAGKETTGTPKAKRKHQSSIEECVGNSTAQESVDTVRVKKGSKQKTKLHKPKTV